MRSSLALPFLLALPLACTPDDPDGGDDTDSTNAGTTEEASSGGTTDPDGSTGLDDSTAPDETTGPDGTTTEPGDATADPSTTGGGVDQVPPIDAAQLLPWLESGEYLGWPGESGVHPSTGPHFGGVWTYVNDALYQSLESGAPTHPMEAATVKELYGDGDTVRGWSVMVKVQADSASGDGWYWYEIYDGSVYGDGTGLGICTGCHGGGSDYVLTPFPLQ